MVSEHNSVADSKLIMQTMSTQFIQRVIDWIWQNRSKLVIAIVFIAILAVLASGFYRVDIQETAAKRRFGNLVNASVQPGLHWRIPLGIEQVSKFPTARVHTLDIGVNVGPNMSAFTGDVNLIDARLIVQYKVNDLKYYLFRNEEPSLTLQNSVLTAFINVISNMFVYMVLSTEKKHIENTIFNHVSEELEKLKLGMELVTVNMIFVSPPVDAIPAFRAVNDAKAERAEMINVALKRKSLTLAQANGEASHIIENADAIANARIAEAYSTATRFLDLSERDLINSDQTRHTYYWDAVRKIMKDARIIVLKPGEQPPNIAVNLLDSASEPPGIAGERADQEGEHKARAAGRGSDPTDPQHAGSAAAHVIEQVDDRVPGFGAHDVSTEPHHMGPIPDDSRQLPSHVVDPKVKSKVESDSGDLGLPVENRSHSSSGTTTESQEEHQDETGQTQRQTTPKASAKIGSTDQTRLVDATTTATTHITQ